MRYMDKPSASWIAGMENGADFVERIRQSLISDEESPIFPFWKSKSEVFKTLTTLIRSQGIRILYFFFKIPDLLELSWSKGENPSRLQIS